MVLSTRATEFTRAEFTMPEHPDQFQFRKARFLIWSYRELNPGLPRPASTGQIVGHRGRLGIKKEAFP